MVMKQSLVYLGNIIPTLYSKQPVFFHCSFGGCDVKKIRSNTLYANTNPPGNKSISHQTGRTGTNHDSKVPEVGWDMDSFLGGYAWLKRD